MTQSHLLTDCGKFVMIAATLFMGRLALGQTPTHIDPGTGDPSISVFEKPQYILLIVGLIVILVFAYIALKRRRK